MIRPKLIIEYRLQIVIEVFNSVLEIDKAVFLSINPELHVSFAEKYIQGRLMSIRFSSLLQFFRVE